MTLNNLNELSTIIAKIESTHGSVGVLYDILDKSGDLFQNNLPSLDGVFNYFDITNYGIIHAFVLKAKYRALPQLLNSSDVLITQTISFLQLVNRATVEKLYTEVSFIIRSFTELVINCNCAIRGIGPLCHFIPKFQSSPGQLTSIHYQVCQLALIAKSFNTVISVLDNIVFDIDRRKCFEPVDYLLYFYYGGMIYSAIKQWEKAINFFDLCQLMPCEKTSQIMVDANNKRMLISLIHFGTLSQYTYFNRLVSNNTCFNRSKISPPYQELLKAYEIGRPSLLEEVVSSLRQTFEADQNMGLVKQVIANQMKHKIRQLTKTFLTLSLSDLANRVQLPSPEVAENLLVEMIQDGQIFARIDQANKTVFFLDDPENFDSKVMLDEVTDKMNKCFELKLHITKMTQQLVTDRNYVKRAIEIEAKTNKTFS